MKLRRQLALGLLVLASAASPASAELVLRGISWQAPTPPGAKARGFTAIERWIQPAAAKLLRRPRAVITVANRGPKAAEGVVLRYAVTARMSKVGEEGKEGTWTVPFFLASVRVPRVGANQTKEVPLKDLVLDVFLKKSFRSGYWPDALKIQVMVEPRNGEGLEQRILENILPVAAK